MIYQLLSLFSNYQFHKAAVEYQFKLIFTYEETCAGSGSSLAVCCGYFCGSGSHLQALLHEGSRVTLLPFRPPRGSGRLTQSGAPGGLPVLAWLLGAAARVPEAVSGASRDPAGNKEEHFCGEHMPARAGHALRSQQRLWQRTRATASAAPASAAVHVDSHVLAAACSEGLLRVGLSCTGPSIPAASASTAGPGGPSGTAEAPRGGAGWSVCLSPADRRSSSPLAMPAACLCVQQGAPRVQRKRSTSHIQRYTKRMPASLGRRNDDGETGT